ncbi:MAG: hypothetical protein ABH821_02110 [archaeon]
MVKGIPKTESSFGIGRLSLVIVFVIGLVLGIIFGAFYLSVIANPLTVSETEQLKTEKANLVQQLQECLTDSNKVVSGSGLNGECEPCLECETCTAAKCEGILENIFGEENESENNEDNIEEPENLNFECPSDSFIDCAYPYSGNYKEEICSDPLYVRWIRENCDTLVGGD